MMMKMMDMNQEVFGLMLAMIRFSYVLMQQLVQLYGMLNEKQTRQAMLAVAALALLNRKMV